MAVYIAYDQDTKHVKIGMITNEDSDPAELSKKRLAVVASKEKRSNVWLLGVLDGFRGLEKQLHLRFASSRVNGEWFSVSDEMTQFIASCNFSASHKCVACGRMGRPPIYGERTSLLIRLPVELVAKLEAYRATKGLTQTAAIQQIIEQALRKR